MASISTDGGHGGKKSVDHEIPLIPFIDLLLCCIMFLLVTAVWNQLSTMEADLASPSPNAMDRVETPPETPLTVRVGHDGYVVTTEIGDEVTIPKAGEGYDLAAFREHLSARRRLDPNQHLAVVTADDGVSYANVIEAMDALSGSGFGDVTMSGGI